MEQFLTNLIGLDNFQKYGFTIIFLSLILSMLFLITVVMYLIVFVFRKIRDFISDNTNRFINADENILFVVEKQIPSFFVLVYFPLLTILTFFYWINQKFDIINLILGIIWTLGFYYFINVFFIKLVITDKRVLYRNLLSLNYRVIYISNIKSLSANNDAKYGDIINIFLKDSYQKMSFRTVTKAKEVQSLIENLILSPTELETVREERAEKEKSTIIQWAMAIFVIILFVIFKFGLKF